MDQSPRPLPTGAQTKEQGDKDTMSDQQQFISIISEKIEELERSLSSAASQGERDQLKARKKQLREVTKYVSDKSNSPEDRITFIQAKYSQMAQEVLKLEKEQLEVRAQLDQARRERDKAQESLRRSNLVQDKLEELCRQLQKENKEIREEEASARLALQQRFQSVIESVTTKLDAQAAERAAQLTENETLRGKMEDVLKQFDSFNALLQAKEQEVAQQAALCDNLNQRNKLLETANAQLLEAHKVAHAELETLLETRKVNAALQAANVELKEQLESYYTRFNEFEQTIVKSSQVFDGLKKDLENGQRVKASLTRERDELRKRLQVVEAKMMQELTHKQAAEQQLAQYRGLLAAVEGVDAEEVKKIRSQKEALENLCRTLTAQLKAAKAGPTAGTTEAPRSASPAPVASSVALAEPSSPPSPPTESAAAGAPAEQDNAAVLLGATMTGAAAPGESVATYLSPTQVKASSAQGQRSPRYHGHGKANLAMGSPSGTQAVPASPSRAPPSAAGPLEDAAAAAPARVNGAGQSPQPTTPHKVMAYGGVLLPMSLDSGSGTESEPFISLGDSAASRPE